MKRDVDLCRLILFDLEDNPKATGAAIVSLHIKDRDPAEVAYHVRLLASGGFIEAARGKTTSGEEVYSPKCLTYAGHEFIEASRKDTLWRKATTTVLKKTGGLSFDVVKALLIKWATDAVLRGGS
jgi:hypothetical protein